jgi:hypothetical protein
MFMSCNAMQHSTQKKRVSSRDTTNEEPVNTKTIAHRHSRQNMDHQQAT